MECIFLWIVEAEGTIAGKPAPTMECIFLGIVEAEGTIAGKPAPTFGMHFPVDC